MVAAVVAAVAGSFAADAAVELAGAALWGTLAGEATAGLVMGAVSIATSTVVGGIVRGALSGSPDAPGQQSAIARASGILLNTASNVEPIPVIYGSRRVGGAYALREVSGASNEYYNIVLVLCEGEISAINTVYLDDVPITDPRFAGLVTVEKYLGSDTQAASAALQSELPGKWTAAHTLSGVAYVYIKLQYDQNAFTGEPTITCDVDGKMVYDPRDGLTKFSNNPSLCIRDYLTNARYGRGIPASAINDVKGAVAANYCDQLVTTPGGMQKRYTCDGVVNTADSTFANYKLLLTSCRGFPVYSGGKHSVVIDAPAVAPFEFNEDNIVGRWTIKLSDKKSRYNRIRANFFNPDTQWQPDIWPEDSPALRALDNGCLLEGQIDLPFTANRYTVQQLSQMALAQSRFGTVCQFTATIAGMRCEVGDVVNITHSTPGWIAKPFRVMRIALLSSDEVEVTCREYDGSVFALNPLTAPAQSPATNLPNPFFVMPPGAPTAVESLYQTSGSAGVKSRVTLTWPASLDAFAVECQAEYQTEGASSWTVLSRVSGTQAIFNDIAPGRYLFRAKAINSLGISSDYATSPVTEVFGLLAAPADVTGLSVHAMAGLAYLSWDLDPDLDVRIGGRIVVRWSPKTSGASWNDGIVLDEFNGDAVAAVTSLMTGTYMAKARDSSGGYSTNAAAFVATESVVTGWTTVGTSIQHPAFSGAKPSTAAVDGLLKLDGSTLVDSMPGNIDSLGVWDSIGGVNPIGTYDFAATMDLVTVAGRRYSAAIQALSVDTGDYWDARSGTIDSWGLADGGVIDDCDATLFIRTTSDDPAGSPIWSAWTQFFVADFTCRAAQFRLQLTSGNATHNILVSALSVTAKIPV